MRAAVVRGHLGVPEVEQWQPPEPGPGEALIELRAAPITPLDLLCASGTSYFGPPELDGDGDAIRSWLGFAPRKDSSR